MRFIYFIFILFVIIGCKEKPLKRQISKIDLTTDFEELTKKMSDYDTIQLSMNLSLCVYMGYESHQITKCGDTLFFKGEKTEFVDKKIKYDEVKISVNDTNLKLDDFLKTNKFRVKNCYDNGARLILKSDTTAIYFFSRGLGNSSNLIVGYLDMMSKIYPEQQNKREILPPPETEMIDLIGK